MKRKDGQPKHRPTYGVAPVPRALPVADFKILTDAVEMQSQRALELYRVAMAAPAALVIRRVA